MFTGVPQKSRAVAKSYFDEHLSHNDYYMQGEVEVGRWIGLGGERLGLLEGQPVDREAFMSLCDNLHPNSGLRLTQRQNQEGDRRIFFDFTCSAPKSVSIVAEIMKDERVTRAHQEAARFGAKELEQYAATRIRIGGVEEDRATRNVIGAEFLHSSSRALDPQLHTHFTFFNATYDDQEQRWKALQTSDMFAASQYATEVYRNELTRRLNDLGYGVEPTAKGFEIKGVEPKLIERFSKRSQERDKVVGEMEQRLGRKLDNNEVSIAVHQTRSRKLKGITTQEVHKRQLDQLSPAERARLQAVKDRADGFRVTHLENVSEQTALNQSSSHVFERASVVSKEELLRHALIAGRGQVDLDELKSTLKSSPEFIRVTGQRDVATLVSTREILESELYLVKTLNAGKDSCPALAPGFQMVSTLGPDQQQALTHVLNSPDQFTGIRGLAGTGKTTALSELSRALDSSGHSALFCAPTAAATDVLRKDGFSAVTLAKLLHDKELQSDLGRHSVIVLDEAGLVGTGDMMELFKVVDKSGARVVFSGDTGQHASVSRGDALRILEEHSRYSFRELSTIRRQQAQDYRRVVELAAQHQPKTAFDHLNRLGWVHELAALGSEPALYKAAAAAYLESRSNGKSALLVAPTWTEIESVTDAVRKQLKKNEVLSSREVAVPIFNSLSWTDAQKRQINQYYPGQRIVFGQDSGTFRQHEQIEILAVDQKKNALQVRREDGSTHLFRPRTGTSFDVGEQRHIGVAKGDLILLQANRTKEGLINGQVATVQSVENQRDAGPKITLTDGRVLPPDYRQFSHGYCITSHSAQARTVDAVMLVASSRSGPAIHQEQFYVSVSRGRQQCQVFTDDKELLRNRISRSTQRKAALELVAEALAKAGFSPPAIKPSEITTREPLHQTKLDATSRCPQRMIHEQISQQINQHLGASVTLDKSTLNLEPAALQAAIAPPVLEIEPPQRRRSRGISL